MRNDMNAKIADAIREVTARVQKEIESGNRSRMIDADDLVEILLSIADRIDPPFKTGICPRCGEDDPDELTRQSDGRVFCETCEMIYELVRIPWSVGD